MLWFEVGSFGLDLIDVGVLFWAYDCAFGLGI